ncbi:hypothetical protein [Pseudomonas koreensis]|uniref:hypothetical protein n=1 Tax=Pseudomonas koreensis TaxID=198620 RepID=UPI003D960DCE
MRQLQFGFLVACFTFVATEVVADEVVDSSAIYEKKIMLVTDSAAKICAEFSDKGESEEFRMEGELNAEVSKLWRALAELGVQIKSDYSAQKYQGVLKDQVLSAMKESNSCRLDVFHSLLNEVDKARVQVPDTAPVTKNQITHGNGSHNIGNVSGGVININGK